ncbi:MAG: DUF4437 domain-containing protein [Thermoanaerobaculia bacterium]
MRKKNVLAFGVSFLLAAAALAQSAEAPKMGPGAPVFVPAAELKWIVLDEATPGVKVANAWGDLRTGAYGAFFKFPSGFAAPLHTHSADAKIVVVSGTFIQGPERKPEVRLGPGSYLMQPGGDYRHTTRCEGASGCVIFATGDSAFTLTPAEGASRGEIEPAGRLRAASG